MRVKLLLGVASVTVLALAVLAARVRSPTDSAKAAAVTSGCFSRWSVYEGELDARRVEVVMSKFSGNATIVELAPEGTFVKQGDLLVRFDNSEVKRDLLRLERDHALVKSDLESLEKAKLPLELQDLDALFLEAKASYEAEQQYLADSRELLSEDLVSGHEIEQQSMKVVRARSVMEKLSNQLKLTKEYLHPDRLERARATLVAAEQELTLARQQLDNCTVTAPADGTVVYRPMHLGTEYRHVRVGDNIYQNKPFMALPDMSDLIVECFVPEAELSLVGEGDRAVVTPLAYPKLEIGGRVEKVGGTAQAMPGKSAWQKYFRVVIAVNTPHADLRPGMSVHARVLSYQNPNAVLIPRSAVQWKDGSPQVQVKHFRGWRTRPLLLGRANFAHFEVLKGLAPGDTVLIP